MAPSNKNASAAKDRRKSGTTTATVPAPSSPSKTSHIVVLKVEPKRLRAIWDPASLKEDTPPPKEESTPSAAPPATQNSNGENASDSTPNTPGAGTPAPQPATMGPPVEGPKKKGPKRTAAALGANGEPKPRGKPGPKKKQRLEDGSIEPSGRGGLSAHKLGPKANQGAINAGLRALDRSGKPCRKWTKGSFKVKSFTGVVWEIPRWTAPPKVVPTETSASDADNSNPVSTGGDSSKENNTPNPLVPNGANGTNGTNGVNGTTGAKLDVVMNGTGASSQAKSEVVSNTNDGDVTMMDVDTTTVASAGPASVAAADSNVPTPAPVPIAAN
ncbi:INO80 complex subunit Ies4 domain containing protein [Naviculisporaceae sp. PSN 640]